MPRKTDGILFELHPGPSKGDDDKPLLYAKPVIQRKHDVDDIDAFCAKYRNASVGEMRRFFTLLEDLTTMWLREGHRVETPFGTFAPKLKLTGKHTDPEKVKGRDVEYAGVEFIPSKKFVKDADCSRDGFRYKKGCVGNSQILDTEAMETALRNSMRNGYITIKSFQYHSGLKYNSAKNYLDSLCTGDNPKLSRYRDGRVWHYTVHSQR